MKATNSKHTLSQRRAGRARRLYFSTALALALSGYVLG